MIKILKDHRWQRAQQLLGRGRKMSVYELEYLRLLGDKVLVAQILGFLIALKFISGSHVLMMIMPQLLNIKSVGGKVLVEALEDTSIVKRLRRASANGRSNTRGRKKQNVDSVLLITLILIISSGSRSLQHPFMVDFLLVHASNGSIVSGINPFAGFQVSLVIQVHLKMLKPNDEEHIIV